MVLPDNRKGLGWVPDRYDPRDVAFAALFRQSIPSSTILEDQNYAFLEPIYSQGNSGSCVANAVAAAVRFLARKTQEDNKKTGSPKPVTAAALDPSRLFIYYNARAYRWMQRAYTDEPDWPSVIGDDGCQIRDALKSLGRFGVCTDESWPFQIAEEKDAEGALVSNVASIYDRPSPVAYEDAKQTVATYYRRLDVLYADNIKENKLTVDTRRSADGDALLSNVKACLAEGYPVVFACQWFRSFNGKNFKSEGAPQGAFGRFPPRPDNEKVDGGHAMIIIGFNDTENAVLVQNSWGQNNNPRFWMDYSWIRNEVATRDFWTIRGMDKTPLPKRSWKFAPIKTGEKVSLGGASTIATVCRQQGTVEIMWIDQTRNVRASFFYGKPEEVSSSESWKPYGSPQGKAMKGSGIAAVSCMSSKMQFFWVGEDGAIKSRKWQGDKYDWKDDSIPSPNSKKASGSVMALSRKEGLIEIWWKTESGSINAAFRFDTAEKEGEWRTYEASSTANSTCNGNLAVASRQADHQELWWIEDNGKIGARYFDQDWKTYSPDPIPFEKTHCASTRSRITSACRDNNNMAMFYLTHSGRMRGAFYKGNDSVKWQEEMLYSGDEYTTARLDSDIKAISFVKEQYEIVCVGPDCSLFSTTVFPALTGSEGKRPMHKEFIVPSGDVAIGSPLGIFKFKDTWGYGVFYVDKAGQLMIAYCNSPA